MLDLLLYIGPGLGLATIIIIIVVLLLVLGSILIIIWTPIKRFFRKLTNKSTRN